MAADLSRQALLRASGRFDAAWYRRTYSDVDMVGMDPADHYLTYGYRMDRDPGPDFCTRFVRLAYPVGQNEPVTRLAEMAGQGMPLQPMPDRILHAAGEVARLHGHDRAIRLAEAHLPADLAHTAHALRANAAVTAGDSAGWCRHFNAYLAHFGIAPILLQGDGSVFDRLGCEGLAAVTGGPLVSVIMPAWNATETLLKAAGSVLAQTWRNIELLIVDDASTDGTWALMQEIAAQDARVRILRNTVNAGPYVAKNLALLEAQGEWITGHDADDWAHPQRIERHLAEAVAAGADASLTYMVRITPEGRCTQLRPVSELSCDGLARICFISCLFRAGTLRSELGFWDSVRFAADSEMIDRAAHVLGDRFATFRQVGMIQLDIATSLTNHPQFGSGPTGLSPVRKDYAQSFAAWHERALRPETAFLPFPQSARRYAAAAEMVVPSDVIARNLAGRKGVATPRDWPAGPDFMPGGRTYPAGTVRERWELHGRRLVYRHRAIDLFWEMPDGYTLPRDAVLSLAEYLLLAPRGETVGLQDDPRGGERVAVAFSGGMNSAGALELLPDPVAIHTRVAVPKGKGGTATALQAVANTGGMAILSNWDDLNPVYGRRAGAWGEAGFTITAVLLADFLNLGVIADGNGLEYAYLDQGLRFRRRDHAQVLRAFESAGLRYCMPNAGLTEVSTSRIAGGDRFAMACRRGTGGVPCRNCFRCYRRLALAGGVIAPDHETEQKLAGDPIPMLHALLWARDHHGLHHPAFDGIDKDISWVERWYPGAAEFLPPEVGGHVMERLEHFGIAPLEDGATLEAWVARA